jgi:brefeldin A-inhibited guanine nucleotide-exchange protein
MDIERRAYIGALAGFTLLENLREMRIKNIECIDTLLQLALTDGNYLRDSWRQVLKIVSLLERMYLLGTGQKVNDALPDGSNQGTPTRRTGPNYEVTNAQSVAAAIPSVAIDRIFTNSVGLSSFAILDFVKSLCAVSQEELVQTVPRIFCLQKLVEIADYNMYRVRMVWSKIWRELAQHFTLAALLKNQHVALYAVDSLRQLAIKFLEKDELSTFHFQKEFMQPFGSVVRVAKELLTHSPLLTFSFLGWYLRMRISRSERWSFTALLK